MPNVCVICRPSLLVLSGEGGVDTSASGPSVAGTGSLTPEASRLEHMGAGPSIAPPKETLETILLALDAEK